MAANRLVEVMLVEDMTGDEYLLLAEPHDGGVVSVQLCSGKLRVVRVDLNWKEERIRGKSIAAWPREQCGWDADLNLILNTCPPYPPPLLPSICQVGVVL